MLKVCLFSLWSTAMVIGFDKKKNHKGNINIIFSVTEGKASEHFLKSKTMKNAAVQINLESSTPLCHILKNHSLHDTDLCISYVNKKRTEDSNYWWKGGKELLSPLTTAQCIPYFYRVRHMYDQNPPLILTDRRWS